MTSIELLNSLSEEVSLMVAEIDETFSNLPDDVLNLKENPASWSLLECFEHLNRYSRFYNKEIEKRLIHGNETVIVTVKSTWIGRKSIASMHPSNTKKQKTLKHLNPLNSTLTRVTMDEFLQHQKDLVILLAKAKNADVNKVKIPVEFLPLLKLTLGDAFRFLVAHQQRHFLQLRRTLKFAQLKEEGFLKV